MTRVPRVALFADCFHEVNGVAGTMRHLRQFAAGRALPMLCVRAGSQTGVLSSGDVELRRSALRIAVDHDLAFDLAFARFLPMLRRHLESFRPDLIHVTGPGDIGILGVLLSRQLRMPLVASWHTNIHEFAARRMQAVLPGPLKARVPEVVEKTVLRLATLFYRIPRLLFAPNAELAAMLAAGTGRPAHAMSRGIDIDLFHPRRRVRPRDALTFGYVGRLTPEKNVRLLIDVGRALGAARAPNHRFLIVGDGGELPVLAAALPQAELPGVLKGERLAEAYASMDVMLFPSHTDTFGNVVLEAQASGVPVVVTASGGPKYLVEDGVTGWVATDDSDFISHAVAIARAGRVPAGMGRAARASAERRGWAKVFEDLYRSYASALKGADNSLAVPEPAEKG